ncbi:hypothetical protein [Legionella sp.]|uniref:hypothetical protein n=1 Tax=Legionella sp. TaxID=459 RepID=UPI003CAF786A
MYANSTFTIYNFISAPMWATTSDLYKVIDILPNLDWRDTPVGARLELTAKSQDELLSNFEAAQNKAKAQCKDGDAFHPWPKNLTDLWRRYSGHGYKDDKVNELKFMTLAMILGFIIGPGLSYFIHESSTAISLATPFILASQV